MTDTKRHIALFVTSPYRTTENEKTWWYPEQVEAPNKSRQTNETAIRYFQWYLEGRVLPKGQKLECAFALVTEEAKKDWNEIDGKLTVLMNDILGKEEREKSRLKTVVLPEDGGLQGAFKSACKLVDELQGYLAGEDKTKNGYDEMKNVTVHFDMTGGQKHYVMLLMALIQLLKSYGITIGKVVYGDLNKEKTGGKVEDVSPIMDMYTLISGVEEFRQYASVKLLKEYFSENEWARASKELKSLIIGMQLFSENIKLCNKFENVQAQIKELGKNFEDYQKHIETTLGTNTGNEERFFAKLFSSIKLSYSDIINAGEDLSKNKIEIIRWCVTHGLIQQAVTFYSEWIGKIIIDKLIIGETLKEECISKKRGNCDWKTYLIRQYSPFFSYEDLKDLLKPENRSKYKYSLIKGKNKQLDRCLDKVVQLQAQNLNTDMLIKCLSDLKEDDPVRKVFEVSTETEGDWEKYIEKECYENKFEHIFINCLNSVKESDLLRIFGLKHRFNPRGATIKEIKKDRKLCFDYMLRQHDLLQKIMIAKEGGFTERELEETVGLYAQIYYCHRNMMNHAEYTIDKTGTQTVENMIMKSLEYLDK